MRRAGAGMVALITGGSSGIGLATVRALAAGGAERVFAVGRSLERLRGLCEETGAVPLIADVGDPASVRQMATQLGGQTHRLDLLVNCAGQLEVGPADRLGPEIAERLMRVNFHGAVAMIHACLPLLRTGQRPVVVNVSSLAGRVALPFMAAYAASKFALNGYSHALRQELRPLGIHVGLVAPGPVQTPMVDGCLGGPYYQLPAGVPVLEPESVAEAILDVARRRLREVIIPRRVGAAARAGAAWPGLVDLVYRRTRAEVADELDLSGAEVQDISGRRFGSEESVLWWEQ